MSGLENRSKLAEDDDVDHHKIGDDFKGAEAMSLPEVLTLLKAKVQDDSGKGEETSATKTSVFEKTLAYVERFSQPGVTAEQCNKARGSLSNGELGLTEFEQASLISLMPPNFEQATALLPSLLTDRTVIVGDPPSEVTYTPPKEDLLERALHDVETYMTA